MLLKRLRLNNIRSYINQEINFPEGSTLLSGNIGSGKSTILLAIDFAFFGLKRPELPGAALLRNGTNQGSVELTFQINNNNITIKRTLKRSKDSVTQDTGYIIINEQKQDLSTTELKQRILDIFHYPKELLTKSKDLIYTYTIYTPQDRMKQILLGDKDFRLDTLRKVFGIDKYKRINENLNIYVKSLKEKRKILKAKTEDLYKKLQEKENNENKLKEENLKLESLDREIKEKLEKVNEIKVRLKTTEDKIKELNKIKQDIVLNNSNLTHFLNQREINNRKIEDLNRVISETKVSDIDTEAIKEEIKTIGENIKSIEDKNKDLLYKINKAEIKISNSEELKKSVIELDYCPTCKQEVSKEHKHEIEERENLEIKTSKEILSLGNKELIENEKIILGNKEKLESLRKKEEEFYLIKLKLERLDDRKLELQETSKKQEELKRKIGDANLKKQELNNKLADYSGVEERFNEVRNELEIKQENLKKVEIEKAGISREVLNLKSLIENLEKEVKEKLELQNKITKITKLQEFLESGFSNLMQVMERQIMLRVHSDFDLLFQKWFNILVEAKELEMKLDYEFSPKIIQNGHDIDYLNLSGGEKTAAALSYRLALNQTINKLMSKIRTKDIIILDEPTDGFSAEQLDRMRLVLDELEVKQLIIVSHEAKIESFVDNTVRLRKEGHISSIVQ